MRLGNRVGVFGGAGFVGRSVLSALSQAGFEVNVFVRRPERYRDLMLLSGVKLVRFEDWSTDTLVKTLKQQDIIINLFADRSNPSETLDSSELVAKTQMLKQATERAGVARFIHLSQIGANASQAKSDWLRVLGEVDAIIHNMAHPSTTILRTGLLIGDGDCTTSLYKQQLSRLSLMMVANADRQVQPLWVNDFAQALVSTIRQPESFNKKIEVAGEEALSIENLAHWVKQLMGLEQAVIMPMCQMNTRFMLLLGPLAPFKVTNQTQQYLLQHDLTTEQSFTELFGFAPHSLESVLSTYIVPSTQRYRLDFFRSQAGRYQHEFQ